MFIAGPAHKPTNGAHDSESAVKLNGIASGSTAPGSPIIGNDKASKKKLSKKEGKAESGANAVVDDNTALSASAAAKPLPRSLAPSPAPSTSANRSDLISPTESTGARTPVTNRPKRNPWTLFVNQLPVPVSEDEIKTFFGSAASNVGFYQS